MHQNGRPIRVAAAGDVHASPAERDRVVAAFESIESGTDLVLLAGDLTTCGDPDEAAVLAEACRGLDVPVCAVLGNHDWHLNRTQEVAVELGRAGIRLLERSSERFELRGLDVGVVGMKGFVGGFPDYVLPDFGEPLLREVY
jgi:predicted MPP superfamily phosphohydrolase